MMTTRIRKKIFLNLPKRERTTRNRATTNLPWMMTTMKMMRTWSLWKTRMMMTTIRVVEQRACSQCYFFYFAQPSRRHDVALWDVPVVIAVVELHRVRPVAVHRRDLPRKRITSLPLRHHAHSDPQLRLQPTARDLFQLLEESVGAMLQLLRRHCRSVFLERLLDHGLRVGKGLDKHYCLPDIHVIIIIVVLVIVVAVDVENDVRPRGQQALYDRSLRP
mmetsp:Transcript_122459/g.183073  ORF Transcript_122459/g.183073 Transcript_122459/m.183073 type:complete len:219 (-) Transcript_122459:178-834(-)